MADGSLKSILVVDDTPANIDILMEILADKYDVSVATDGPSALESVAEDKPDLILLDVMMPGMDGYEVCSRLKSSEQTKDIPVIFITAMTEIEDEIKGFEAGAIDYITKPFSPPVVERRVGSVLKLEEKTQQLELLAKKLSKYLSPQVYVSIFRGERDVAVESHRKKLTIFFSDIVNFTATTEGMESESLTDLLNSYLDEMSTIALKYGGTIDKFIGDAILIFFGDPLSRGDKEDAVACVSMAIEMRNRMKELQKKWYSFGIQNPFRVRAGISTGYCTVGNFGSKSRMDYTIIGTQVNTASRLESSASPDQIIISHETWSLVKDEIDCLKHGLLTVKGIHHPIQTYLVTDFRYSVNKETSRITAQQLMDAADSIEASESIGDAYAMLAGKELQHPLVITESGVPAGIICLAVILNLMDSDTSKAVYFSRPVRELGLRKALVIDKDWPLPEIKELYMNRSDFGMYDPVLVTDDEELAGLIPAYRLLKHIL